MRDGGHAMRGMLRAGRGRSLFGINPLDKSPKQRKKQTFNKFWWGLMGSFVSRDLI